MKHIIVVTYGPNFLGFHIFSELLTNDGNPTEFEATSYKWTCTLTSESEIPCIKQVHTEQIIIHTKLQPNNIIYTMKPVIGMEYVIHKFERGDLIRPHSAISRNRRKPNWGPQGKAWWKVFLIHDNRISNYTGVKYEPNLQTRYHRSVKNYDIFDIKSAKLCTNGFFKAENKRLDEFVNIWLHIWQLNENVRQNPVYIGTYFLAWETCKSIFKLPVCVVP